MLGTGDREQARGLGSPQRRGRAMTPVMASKVWEGIWYFEVWYLGSRF